jgi:hypothetical protein
MKNLQIILIASLIFSTTMLFAFNISTTKADPPSVVPQQFINGPLSGLSQNASGKVDWVITGNWKSNLLSNTNRQNSNVFDATIEMIKPDGTGRHTHTLTNFTVINISYPNSNTIMYNGVSTVTMKEGPIMNVPTTLLLSNNNIISIIFDPNSVQHHFGDTPFYGIITNNNGSINGPSGSSNGLQNGSIGGLLHGSINQLQNGLQNGPIGGLLHGSINQLQNGSIGGLLHGSINQLQNGLQNGSIGGLLHGLLH